jgi:ribosomal protein S18 acetylase RimI-like enzyme
VAGEGIVRFRYRLNAGQPSPRWPSGYACRTLQVEDAQAVHRLLRDAYRQDREVPDFEAWWARLSGDDEFDPNLCFLAVDAHGELAGAALCWTSAFLKDLAVRAESRRLGIGESLLRHVFMTFGQRHAQTVDLKTEADNRNAIRLYEKVGMYGIPLAG